MLEEIAARRSTAKWFTTWKVDAVEDPLKTQIARNFSKVESRCACRLGLFEEEDDESKDSSWFPSWLNPFSGSDKDKVEKFAKTQVKDKEEPEDGCWWFCDWIPLIAGTEKDAQASVGPAKSVAVLDQSHLDSAIEPFDEGFTCGMASAFNGIRFSVANVADLLQMRPTTFDVAPHCIDINIADLLGIDKWLNFLSSVSVYDVQAKNVQVGFSVPLARAPGV